MQGRRVPGGLFIDLQGMFWPPILDSFLKEWEVADCWSQHASFYVCMRSINRRWYDPADILNGERELREEREAEEAARDCIFAFLIAADYHAPWLRFVDYHGKDSTWVVWQWALSR